MGRVKQVIVVRTKFPDGKGGTIGIRKGKEDAQVSHASMAFMSEILRHCLNKTATLPQTAIDKYLSFMDLSHFVSEVLQETVQQALGADGCIWINGTFDKVVCAVETDDELQEIYQKAKDAGLTVHMITDAGKTEFSEPTRTCLAIGPHDESRIDPITGHLKLR